MLAKLTTGNWIAIWAIIVPVAIVILGGIYKHFSSKDEGKTSIVTRENSPDQTNIIENSPHSETYQAGRDIHITQNSERASSETINTLTVEARLTCDMKEGAELPPPEVQHMLFGGDSYLKGPAASVALKLQSPVIFRRQRENKIVVINNFSLESGSQLQNMPAEALKNYHLILVPITTVVYGKAFEKFTLFEVSFMLNGNNLWYGSYECNDLFQSGLEFKYPLSELHKKLKE